MTGLDKKSKRKGRDRAVDMSAQPEPPAWVAARAASKPEWDARAVFPVFTDESLPFEAQIYQRTRRSPSGGPILDFAVGIQIRHRDADEEWIDVARVDCADGAIHVDRCRSDGDEFKDFEAAPSECRDDLDTAFKWALGTFGT
jgi:hypothetical protein